MSQNWTNGKLSQGVKSRMIKLAKGKFVIPSIRRSVCHDFTLTVKCKLYNNIILFFSSALDDGDVDEAHHIHVSLMVDFVAEVGINFYSFKFSLLHTRLNDHLLCALVCPFVIFQETRPINIVHFTMLRCAVLPCPALHCIVMCCSVLFCCGVLCGVCYSITADHLFASY